MKTIIVLAITALALSACAADEPDTGVLPVNDGEAPAGDSATCLAGEPDCADDPSNGQDVTELPAELGDITIADAIDGGPGGTVTVAGFIVATGDEVLLCEALAESFPPQCGGLSIPVDGFGEVELQGLPSEGDVTWSDFPITLQGEVVDGRLVVG
jgi:hypothetical protein